MAGFDCCTNVQMCLLFTFNFIIWLFGLACLGVGIWALVDEEFINTIESILGTGEYGVSLATIQGAAGLLIAIGAVTFLIAFCGCCGAMKKNKFLLASYITVMLLLLAMQITAVILMIVFQSTVNAMSADVFLHWVKYDVRYNSTLYANEGQKYATEIVAINQFDGMCCAVNGPSDYTYSQYQNDTKGSCKVPETCCVQQSGATWNAPIPVNRVNCCQANNATYTYLNGCQISFYSILMFPYWMLYVVGICFIVFQILVTVFACVVYRAIDDYGMTGFN